MGSMGEMDDRQNGLVEVLSKFSSAVKQMLVQNSIPPIGPGSVAKVTPASLLVNVAKDLASQGKRIPEDIGVLMSLLETKVNNGLIDDRKYLVSR
jgi:hypothetical protein